MNSLALIPETAVKSVLVTGPESSGKTSLVIRLAEIFDDLYVPECARQYLQELQREYRVEDVLEIHQKQKKNEAALYKRAEKVLFVDTSSLVIDIWIREKYGAYDPQISLSVMEMNYDLILLCTPDLDWELDPLRENPTDRDRLFQLYQARLDLFGLPYSIIQGRGEGRIEQARLLVKQMLG